MSLAAAMLFWQAAMSIFTKPSIFKYGRYSTFRYFPRAGTRSGGAPFGGGGAGDEEEGGRAAAEGQEQAAKTGRRSRARSRVKESGAQ